MLRTRVAVLFSVVVVGSACLSTAAAAEEPIRILVLSDFADALSDLVEDIPNLEFVTAANADEIAMNVMESDAAVGVWGDFADALTPGAKNLEWIQSASAGVEGFLRVPEIVESKMVLTNAKIIQGPEIGDHAMALLLNLTRDIKGFNEQMATGWKRESRLPLIELRGKTMLVIGLGGIGYQVAERAAAFGMRVLATDPKDIPYSSAVDYLGKPDELHALLPKADVVAVCAPRTPATEKMLGVEEFALMKKGVYVISVSRGALIDTDALVAALESGTVRAAGLDVTDPEPLPIGHALWKMPNVTITPHVAGESDGIEERMIQLFRENIKRFVEGLPLRNVVDKKAGY
jgi:phosphoglycerate dehydrogenase-like enzyme